MFLKYLLISGYFAISLYDALSLGFYLSKLSRIYFKNSGYYSSIFPLKPYNIFLLSSFSFLSKKAWLPVKRWKRTHPRDQISALQPINFASRS
jgi:hypothetical protein